MKIAILSQGKYKPIGPFVRNYIANLPFEKIVIYGGEIPFLTGNFSEITIKIINQLILVLSFMNKERSFAIKRNIAKCILKRNKIDCVVGEYFNISSEFTSICKGLGIKLIPIGLGYELTNDNVLKNYCKKYEELLTYSETSFVVSETLLTKLKILGVNTENVKINPIGAEDIFFNLNPDFNTQTFLAIGRFVEKKAPHITIKAFANVLRDFSNAKLIMAGDGPLLESSQQLVKDLKIENSVVFVGWISREEQIELIKKSSIFVQHSVVSKSGDSEGSPVAIIEASASGMPVISTFHAGIPKIILHEETGILVNENDTDGMAKAMHQLVSNPIMARSFGSSGRKFILEHFSNKAHIKTFINAINR